MKGETIFLCLEGYLKKHNIPLENITAVATNDAPPILGCYPALIEKKVLSVQTIQY